MLPVQKEDFRTNRADYVIARCGRSAADDDRDELLARKQSLCLRERRAARLAANPCESLPPRARPLGRHWRFVGNLRDHAIRERAAY